MFSRYLVSLMVVGAGLLASCERETRAFHDQAPAKNDVSPTSFRVGGTPRPVAKNPQADEYERNAYHIGEGKRYYEWYNCYSCHAAGGGDIGPPLMDDKWRYGGEIEQIYSSIVEGRPNGMPSFAGRIPEQQVWEIAAYVRSMSGNAAKDAVPSRGDEMKNTKPLTQIPHQPVRSEPPKVER
ncbi:c-type cytochrome [Steroidobacter flavus]|uniref:C-type cytochrome n=1 Tax=Steroidobacter flavus TaxID=1842136 RepID=A0ABV8SNH9_9GAMM